MKKIIDGKGRLFGKVSLIDIGIVLVVAVLVIGFVYRRSSEDILRIVDANDIFYITFAAESVRQMSIDAVAVGDIFYIQHDQRPLGEVVALDTVPARQIMARSDGTAVLAPVEGRYNLIITMKTSGRIRDEGFFANGTNQISIGGSKMIESNMILLQAFIRDVEAQN